ncbi:hypothetical protein F4859DRAFT_161092 [Xylaria cf. heliscus]|nr:hypothetical protein F4859DRAFT_161092 [Xylaria cf. heliscus]
MRPNVAISGLLACSIGTSAASRTAEGLLALRRDTRIAVRVPGSNSTVTVERTSPDLSISDGAVPQASPLTFWFKAQGVEIRTVWLKKYNASGDGSSDVVIANKTFLIPEPPSSTGGNAMLNSGERDVGLDSRLKRDLLSTSENNSIIIAWNSDDGIVSNLASDDFDQPLYLECEWANSTNLGKSTTQLFAVYRNDAVTATQKLDQARGASDPGAPARQETSSLTPTSPSPSTTGAEASASPTSPASSGTTSQPAATVGLAPDSSSSAKATGTGLNRNGVIGVAVGVSVGGLLVAGTLLWLFCFRRRLAAARRRGGGGGAATHHAMPSYGSDVGVRAMMQDKEIPVVLESSSPRSAYGGGGGGIGIGVAVTGDEERPSTEHYAPYSDRSTTSPTPTPDHRRAASSGTTTTTSAATAVAGAGGSTPVLGATGQTDPSWTRGAASPTPVIASRYAHLVEEGMTDDEIRRLEEEERQLDAAIEHAGRGGHS